MTDEVSFVAAATSSGASHHLPLEGKAYARRGGLFLYDDIVGKWGIVMICIFMRKGIREYWHGIRQCEHKRSK